MCQPGNQSIFQACKDKILNNAGRINMSNREMRLILQSHGGCMIGSPVDKESTAILR
jgi:hypothetical protein